MSLVADVYLIKLNQTTMNTTYNKMRNLSIRAGLVQHMHVRRIHLRYEINRYKYYNKEKYGQQFDRMVNDLLLISAEIRDHKQQIKQL